MTHSENVDQVALRRWITAGLQIEEMRALNGDAGYLFSNMIAKYTLAASEYRLSKEALKWFDSRSVDLNVEYARSRYYGKGSPLMYENSVPSSIVRRILLEIAPTSDGIQSALQSAGEVVVVMLEEDDRLRTAGLATRMPQGWKYGDDPHERYREAGIGLSDVFLKVKGEIKR